jgi:hypothetical protein
VVSYETVREWGLRFGRTYANSLKRREPILDDSAGHIRSLVPPSQNVSELLLSQHLATWRQMAQRADAGNPLILLVGALGLEPRTL